MSHRELIDWQRFEAVTSPLPDRMFDLHCGILSSLIVNLARSSDSPPVAPADFFIIREPRPARVVEQPAAAPSESERLRAIWNAG